MDEAERRCLAKTVPRLSRQAYEHAGRTIPEEVQAEMTADRDLRYSPHAHAWNTRHAVFRRTNLPCVTCDDYVRQQHQVTREWTDDESGETVEKERIIYFCPTCQGVAPEHVKPANPHKDRRPPDSEWADPNDERDPDND